MVAFIILVDVQAARPLSSAVGRHLTQDEPIYIPERIFFEPNNDEDDKVEDYLLNVYIGDVEIAEADPAIAAAGGAVRAAMRGDSHRHCPHSPPRLLSPTQAPAWPSCLPMHHCP